MIWIGPLFQSLVYREALEVTFAIYMMLAFLTRSFQFKIYAALIIVLSLAFTLHNFFQIDKGTINMQTFVVESIMNLIFVGFLLSVIYNREMRSRKVYNNERILEVEIRITEEQLSKLVPENALVGIKNDQKVIDLLENVTVCYASIDGFADYYKRNSKPTEVIGLLNRLFSKFDNLCEQHGVQKVHTLGEIYVIMGYSGKINKDKRSLDDAFQEAYNVL